MTIEARANNSCAMVCDSPSCKNEILGPDEDEVKGDGSLMRWRFDPSGKHYCHDCVLGRTADAEMVIQAPIDVAEGDPIVHNGQIIGYAAHAAKAGEAVSLSSSAPAPPPQPIQAGMVGGQDGDGDDGTAVAAAVVGTPREDDGEDFFDGIGDEDETEEDEAGDEDEDEELGESVEERVAELVADLDDGDVFGSTWEGD